MNSNHLKSLEERIALSTGAELLRLRCERAAYLARSGRSERASEEISTLRKELPGSSDSRVSALLNLAEGLYHYYIDGGPIARDRLARARAIAEVGRHQDLAAQASSWLALVHYGSYRFVEMCRCIDDSVESIDSADSITLARTSLTIAIAIHLANRFDLAMPWYRRTHLFAAETRDEAMISAMLHNMAALWLSNCRNSQLGGPVTEDQSRQALMGALSSLNFDGIVGASALHVLTPLLDAQISSLECNFARAVDLYDKCRAEFDVDVLHNWSNWMMADREFCRIQTGYEAGGDEALVAIQTSACEVHQVDEQAATLARLAQAWRITRNEKQAEECERRALKCWREFSSLQARVLAEVLDTPGTVVLAQRFPV